MMKMTIKVIVILTVIKKIREVEGDPEKLIQERREEESLNRNYCLSKLRKMKKKN